MITEDYTSFEISKLLKDKGFPQELGGEGCINTIPYYMQNGHLVTCDINTIRQRYYPEAAAPTLQMAMKLLRKVHNTDIDIDAHCGMLGIRCYVAYVSTYEPYKLTDTDKEFGMTEDDVKHRLVQSKRNTRIPDEHEIIPAHEYFDTYEKAVEAAIKYCLINLIK